MFVSWDLSVILGLLIFLSYNSYATFSEEFLIIAASFLWIDAAGNLFSSALSDTLVSMRLKLRNYFTNLLAQKKEHLVVVLDTHLKRLTLVNEILFLFYVYSKSLLTLLFYKLVLSDLYLATFEVLVQVTESVVSLFKRYFYFSSLFVI